MSRIAIAVALVAGYLTAASADLMPYAATGARGSGRMPTPAKRVCASQDQPPFGTIMQAWSLTMSGPYAGSGITWRRGECKFYLMDQGYSGSIRVWKLDPADPTGTMVSVPWTFTNLGTGTVDIPWGIAWDNDSGCFWISQIVDGNIYGGCFLLRYVWSGSAWVWGGGVGDSWQVGDATEQIGLQCLWSAGMEKNVLNGVFYCAPVHSSPDSLNHIARFDPYTKTDLGRLQYGSETSERGCALIPWDSAYVLTLGPSADQFVKRDSTGFPLAVVTSPEWPADWSVVVPEAISPGDTVFAYCMRCNSDNNLYKVCTGLKWGRLPSAFPHSVRPMYILEPSGTVDSGEVVTPTVVVFNSSDEPASEVSVHLLVDNDRDSVVYHDSTYVTIPARGTDTVEYTPWTPLDRDSSTAVAWTFWEGDSVPEDDTLSQRFLVRVVNVGIASIWPTTDTIDPGVYYPQCEVWNHGNQNVTFRLSFSIMGPSPYFDTIWIRNLLPGGSRTVTVETPWWAFRPGMHIYTLSCSLVGAMRPDSIVFVCTLWVRGGIDKDVACEAILVPSGIIDTLPFTPRARYANYGTSDVTCTTFCWIEDTTTDVIVYADRSPVTVLPGGNSTVAYRPCTLTVEAPYMVSCSIHLAEDQNWLNNAIHQPFRVGAGAEYDVMVSAILAPAGLVDSGAAITPRAEVFNAGLYAETFPVWFRLPDYEDMKEITLGAGLYDTVSFNIWLADFPPGSRTAVAFTLLEGDQNPSNDTMIKPFTIQKRDIGVSAIFWPRDTVPDSTEIYPCFEVTNYGTTVETFVPLFRIGQFQFGGETIFGMVGGTSQTIEFDQSWLSSVGTWVSRAEVIPIPADPYPANNVMTDTFWVLPGSGMEESASPPVRIGLGQPEPSLFRSATWVRFGLPRQSDIFLALYSADGVLVRTLCTGVLPAGYHRIAWNGEDDYGRSCAPGVYYLRMIAGDFLGSHKLVKLQ